MVYDEDGDRSVRRLLGVGFTLMILLLVADGLVGFLSIQSIKATASELVQYESTEIELVDQVEREQGALNAIFYLLAAGPDSENPAQMRDQIDNAEAKIRGIFRGSVRMILSAKCGSAWNPPWPDSVKKREECCPFRAANPTNRENSSGRIKRLLALLRN